MDPNVTSQTGPQTVSCPKCGYQVELGSPICGSCGHAFGGYASGQPIAAPRRTGCLLAVLVVLLVIGGFVYLVLTGISGVVSSVGDTIGDIQEDIQRGIDEQIEEQRPRDDTVEGPYPGVRALARALNDGGLRCKEIQADSVNGSVATGSCQVPRRRGLKTHVQINIYFQAPSLRSVKRIMRERHFTYVHDANWFVVTQPPVARRVQKILGGRLSFEKR